MRILFISSWWPTRVHPTHGNFVQKHARLVAQRHEVRVLAVQEDESLRPFELEVTDFQESGYSGSVVYYGRPRGRLGFLHLVNRLRAYYIGLRRVDGRTDEPPDLVHGHVVIDGGIAAAAWSGWRGIPAVITEHANVWNRPGAVGPLKLLLARWACRRAAFILPVSRHLERSMRGHYGLSGNYRPVSNVVDDTLFSPSPQQSQSAHPLRLLHISNFDPRFKNLSGLLQSYAYLQHHHPGRFSLTVAGDGDPQVVRQAMASARLVAGDVSLHGSLTEVEVADLMQRHHAFVLFSDDENQPVVLLEAQCCGLPCVGTRVGAISDIVTEGETGFLVEAGDERGLASALVRLAENYSTFDRRAISEEASNRYGSHAVLKSLDEVYRQAKQGAGV